MHLRLIDKKILFCLSFFSTLQAAACTAENNGALARQQDMRKDAEDLADVKKAVHKELRKTNTPDPESFNVEFYDCYASCFLGKTILVPKDVVDVIAERKTNKQKYGEFQATLDHEKTHVVENHQLKRYFFAGATSLILIQGLRKARFHNPDRKIMVGLAGAMANFGLLRSVERGQEERADKGVRPDPKILRAKANFFAHRADYFGQDSPFLKLLNTHPLWNFFRPHPLDKERANSFNVRAEKLEQATREKRKN